MSEDGVRLRRITSEDTDKIVAWRNRDFVRKNFIYQKPFTRQGHEAWLREQVTSGHAAQFIICLADGREIGSVYLRDIDRREKTAEFGIFIGEEEALGCGYGTEAAAQLLERAFGELSLERVFLRFLEGNQAARRSYEKAGFRMIENRRETVNLEQGKCGVLFMEIERGTWQRLNEVQNGDLQGTANLRDRSRESGPCS